MKKYPPMLSLKRVLKRPKNKFAHQGKFSKMIVIFVNAL